MSVRSFHSGWLYGMEPRLFRKFYSRLLSGNVNDPSNVLGGPFAAAVLENM